MSLLWERTWPFVVAFILTWLWWWFGARFPTDYTALLGVSGTAAAVLVGFLSTAKAVVLGLTGSDIFQRLKQSGYLDLYLEYVRHAVYGNIVLVVVSLVGFFIEPAQNPSVHPSVVLVFPYVWVIVCGFAIFSFFRVMRQLFKLLKWA